jgi:hypothetical protein
MGNVVLPDLQRVLQCCTSCVRLGACNPTELGIPAGDMTTRLTQIWITNYRFTGHRDELFWERSKFALSHVSRSFVAKAYFCSHQLATNLLVLHLSDRRHVEGMQRD